MSEVAKLLDSCWQPHDGQIPIGRALFYEDYKDIFVEAGRKFGKTDFMAYCFWRFALENPGTESYYFAPLSKQAREILWASNRIQTFGPRELVKSVQKTDMRITFINDSFIKLDGSDNYEWARGITPKGLIGYDEFKDFRPEFHDAFDPNRAAYDCPLVIIGTPPDRHCQFVEMVEQHKSDDSMYYHHATTFDNPYISKEWLEKKKAQLYARGEGDVWEREYMARYIRGGKARIFPMLDESIIRPHDEIMREIVRDRKKLHWILWADPAAASCFAVLFVAVNPYTKQIYVLDEIYEKDQSKMSVGKIGLEIFRKRDELNTREWRQGYDEAETWFCSEMNDRFPDDDGFEPTHKAMAKKEVGLSLIKDILLLGKMTFSDRVKHLFWEMDNYYKDKHGKIPKVNDHLVDNLRYVLCAEAYTLEDEFEYIEKDDIDFRGERLYVGNDNDGFIAL